MNYYKQSFGKYVSCAPNGAFTCTFAPLGFFISLFDMLSNAASNHHVWKHLKTTDRHFKCIPLWSWVKSIIISLCISRLTHSVPHFQWNCIFYETVILKFHITLENWNIKSGILNLSPVYYIIYVSPSLSPLEDTLATGFMGNPLSIPNVCLNQYSCEMTPQWTYPILCWWLANFGMATCFFSSTDRHGIILW